VPLVLVAAAVLSRRSLDSTRWMVAILAFANSMLVLVRTLAPQGSRFTHWTLADRIERPLFTLAGNSVSAPTLGGALLLIATGYAVYRSSSENRRKQNALQQEFESARELQRVLIPETLPTLAGYSLTSGYLPAQQVGGDFFQIIPLEGNRLGSTVIVVGDVSGKGLKAAMAVSFIVGAVYALANILPGPGKLLSALNQRLLSRLQGGFATCVILLLHENGECVIASAGHPPPFLNDAELNIQGAFPLGLFPDVAFEETTIHLKPGDRCTLYTDGLLEARKADGELYGFDRLLALLSTRPNAAQAVDAAVEFGQDDDITVVTLTRTSGS
jgi:serine phosphatase RsbU (regulator of sigma subunit)